MSDDGRPRHKIRHADGRLGWVVATHSVVGHDNVVLTVFVEGGDATGEELFASVPRGQMEEKVQALMRANGWSRAE